MKSVQEMCPPFGNSKLYFRRFYSSRPRLGCVHWREILTQKKCIKTGFLLTSGVDLVRPLHWNSKQCRSPRTHELWESNLKFIFWAINAKKHSKSSYHDWSKTKLTLKVIQRDATAQNRTIQETAHKIWLILKPKTYCFPYPGGTHSSNLSRSVLRQNCQPKKQQNTWKTFLKKRN